MKLEVVTTTEMDDTVRTVVNSLFSELPNLINQYRKFQNRLISVSIFQVLYSKEELMAHT